MKNETMTYTYDQMMGNLAFALKSLMEVLNTNDEANEKMRKLKTASDTVAIILKIMQDSKEALQNIDFHFNMIDVSAGNSNDANANSCVNDDISDSEPKETVETA